MATPKKKIASEKKINYPHPLQDRIVAIEKENPNVSPGGIILVGEDKSGPVRAQVVAVGSGRVDKKGKVFPLAVQVGDVVLVPSYSGTRIQVNNQEVLIFREGDVLGVMI